MGFKKLKKLVILKIKDLKIINRDRKKANKQDVRCIQLTARYKIVFICHYTNPYFDSLLIASYK